nr:P2X purinoceptor 4-like [Lytechinus pictus]
MAPRALYPPRYVIIWQKGYQSTDNVEGSATSKLKGVAYTNISNSSDLRTPFPERYNRVWDVSDYVIPAQQTNGFFVMTNMVLSPMQSRGSCPEDPDIDRESCTSDDECRPDEGIITGNGAKFENKGPEIAPVGRCGVKSMKAVCLNA